MVGFEKFGEVAGEAAAEIGLQHGRRIAVGPGGEFDPVEVRLVERQILRTDEVGIAQEVSPFLRF